MSEPVAQYTVAQLAEPLKRIIYGPFLRIGLEDGKARKSGCSSGAFEYEKLPSVFMALASLQLRGARSHIDRAKLTFLKI